MGACWLCGDYRSGTEGVCVMLPLTKHLGDIKGNGDLLDKLNMEERADGEKAGQEK